MALRWSDIEDIGLALFEKYPDLDPLTVRFTDLLKMITEIPDFEDDPKLCNEKKLEAIQMSWNEEYSNR